MAKILFVSDNFLNESLGIMYLSAYVKTAGHQVDLTLAQDFNKIEHLIDYVQMFAPDLVGFSVMTPQVDQFRTLSKIIKERTGRTIIWGGPHCMFMGEDVMQYGCVDIVCVGEGEEALLELMNRIENNESYDDVQSLYVRTNAGWKQNELGELSNDLDKYPFPDRELYYSKYPLLASFAVKRLLTNRGCPYKCSYCFEPTFFRMYKGHGKIIRRHSPDYVIAEITNIIAKYPTKLIHFSDDTFNLNKNWLKEFCGKYKASFKHPFTCNIELTSIDEEIVKLLKDSGCRGGVFGLECGVEKTRINVLNKKITNARYIEATELLHKYKFMFMMNVMFCLPNESLDDAIESIRFATSLKPYGIRISILKMYKGTELAKFAARNNLSEGTGEFTYKARDVHKDFDKIANMLWASILFLKLPSSLYFAKTILSSKFSRVFRPLLIVNHWQDIKFFCIPLWQAWKYFWNSRKIFIGGMAKAQEDTYTTADGEILSTAEIFNVPAGVIDWTGDRGAKEQYSQTEQESFCYSTMVGEIKESLKNIVHPRLCLDIISVGLVTIADTIDGHVVITITLDECDAGISNMLCSKIRDSVLALEGVFSVEVVVVINRANCEC